MSKYRFRLATLQKLRKTERDQRLAALAEGYRAEQVLAEEQAKLVQQANELRDAERAALAGHYTDINRLMEAQRYATVLQANEQHLAAQAGRLAKEVEQRRQAAIEADRAVRVLELLDERQQRAHRQRERRRETKELDEIAAIRSTFAKCK